MPRELPQKLAHLDLYCGDSWRELVGLGERQFASVCFDKEIVCKLDVSEDSGMSRKRTKSAFYLSAVVFPRWIGQKQEILECDLTWREIYQATFRAAPDGMKLCFHPNVAKFQECPTKHLAATALCDVLHDDGEAFL